MDALEQVPSPDNPEAQVAGRDLLARLLRLIQGLKAPDAQVMLLYLEDVPAAEIGEITGLSAGAVATRIHRLKTMLAGQLGEGGRDHG
jgi:RNA polymerase sigma-70 factor (ECF subfamily)